MKHTKILSFNSTADTTPELATIPHLHCHDSEIGVDFMTATMVLPCKSSWQKLEYG